MKTKLLLLFAACMLLCTHSCKKDSSLNEFAVTTPLEDNTISFMRDGGYYVLDVKSSESWSVEFEDISLDSLAWFTTLETSGEGDSELNLIVDGNYTGIPRQGQFSIVNNSGETMIIKVNQSILLDDEIPSNDETKYYDAFMTKGLGFGFDIKNVAIKRSAVLFSKSQVKKYLADDTFYDIYNETTYSSATPVFVDRDSVISKTDSLGVNLTVNITFGKFTLGIVGGYHNTEKVNDWNKEYNMQVVKTCYEAFLDVPSILALYKDNSIDYKYRKFLFSSGFRSAVDSLDSFLPDTVANYSSENDIKNSKVLAILKKIDNYYGPAFVASSQMGGEMSINLQADSSNIYEDLQITGKITAKIEALIKVDATAEAAYWKSGADILRNTNVWFSILGGNSSSQSDLINILKAPDEINSDIVAPAVANWSSTITIDPENSSNNTAEVLNVELQSIWSLFSNTRAEAAVKAYMMSIYGNDIESCIINLNNFTSK